MTFDCDRLRYSAATVTATSLTATSTQDVLHRPVGSMSAALLFSPLPNPSTLPSDDHDLVDGPHPPLANNNQPFAIGPTPDSTANMTDSAPLTVWAPLLCSSFQAEVSRVAPHVLHQDRQIPLHVHTMTIVSFSVQVMVKLPQTNSQPRSVPNFPSAAFHQTRPSSCQHPPPRFSPGTTTASLLSLPPGAVNNDWGPVSGSFSDPASDDGLLISAAPNPLGLSDIRFWLGTRLVFATGSLIDHIHTHVLRLRLKPSPTARLIGALVRLLPRTIQIWVKTQWPEWFLPPNVILKKRKEGWGGEYENETHMYARLRKIQRVVIPMEMILEESTNRHKNACSKKKLETKIIKNKNLSSTQLILHRCT